MKRKHLYLMLLALVLLSCQKGNEHPKPFTIPEIQQWEPSKGVFQVDENTTIQESNEVASLFAKDWEKLFGSSPETADKGNIRFEIVPGLHREHGEEAYTIKITPNEIVACAATDVGLYWSSRTLLQMLEQGTEIPSGVITDYPKYPMRGFMLDVGRKFFSMEFLESVVQLMSYYKMNTFNIHLNDNGFPEFYDGDWHKTQAAFRLESERHPELTAKDGFYTKADFHQLQVEARKRGVEIIPEIDAPAHTLAFSRYMPEVGSEEYGLDHMDLFEPKSYELLDDLWDEYLGGEEPIFIGDIVHIGTDEYSNKDQAVVEKFRYFTDYYIRKVEEYGKRVALWGSLSHARGETPVKVDGVLMYLWSRDSSEPKEMIELGYEVLTIPDGLVYIVPAAGYYRDYLDIEDLYEKWTPTEMGYMSLEDLHPQLRGGMFAVWNDHPGNGISQQDVYHRLYPAMQTIAAKTWTGNEVTFYFSDFYEKRKQLSEAPGLNMLAIPKSEGVIAQIESPAQGESLGLELEDIGFNYLTSFDLEVGTNPLGTKLFSSDHSILYLSDPVSGNLGFERDGYLFDFRYQVPEGQKVSITILGTNTSTKLLVDGNEVSSLDVIPHPEDAHLKKKRNLSRTLVFPLAELGTFNGTLRQLEVEYLGEK